MYFLMYLKLKFICFILSGSNYYVRILSTIDRELLKPSASVALHKHSNALVDVLPPEADSSISMLQAGMYTKWLQLHCNSWGKYFFSSHQICLFFFCEKMKSLMCSMQTLVEWICRSKRSVKLWSYHSPTLNFTNRLVLILLVVF